jgi:hypothetical protein
MKAEASARGRLLARFLERREQQAAEVR